MEAWRVPPEPPNFMPLSFIVAIRNDERRDLFPGNLQFQMTQSCRLVLRSGLKKP
jgi:hypothetical protein